MSTRVSEIPAALPADIVEHYQLRLSRETDCYDVREGLRAATPDFVLLDVRSHSAYELAHIPGAINLPVGKMTERGLSAWPDDTLFVVYCAGPHCNGTDRAALRLAQLNRRVKVMIGGMTGCADEGFRFAHGPEPGTPTE